MEKIPIAVKYCGGCNPTYERGELMSQVKELLGERYEWVPYNHPSPVVIIIVCGCERVCVIKSFNPNKYPFYLLIDKEAQPEEVASALRQLMNDYQQEEAAHGEQVKSEG